MPTIAERGCVGTLRASVELAIASATGPIGVACSGGIDSMALADAAIAMAGAPRVHVITIDHGLVATSADTAAAVTAWAVGQGAHGVVRRVTVGDRASIEAAARDARYEALEDLVAELDLAVVLLGHTARDQAETVLMRIVRGTGPAGLAGIPAVRGPFVRPFLDHPRELTEAYVAARDLPTWLDPMNADVTLQRVRVRDTILPLVRSENPAVDTALVRLAASAREWLAVIDRAAGPFGQLPIDCPALAGQPPAIRKRALAIALDRVRISFDAVHLEQLDTLVTAPAHGEVAIDLPGARLVRSYDVLTIPVAPDARRFTAPPGHVLRTWQPGDRMRPARLHGKSRKLSDLFIDAKVPRDVRRLAQVLIRASDGVIIWAEHVGIAFGEAEDLEPAPV